MVIFVQYYKHFIFITSSFHPLTSEELCPWPCTIKLFGSLIILTQSKASLFIDLKSNKCFGKTGQLTDAVCNYRSVKLNQTGPSKFLSSSIFFCPITEILNRMVSEPGQLGSLTTVGEVPKKRNYQKLA